MVPATIESKALDRMRDHDTSSLVAKRRSTTDPLHQHEGDDRGHDAVDERGIEGLLSRGDRGADDEPRKHQDGEQRHRRGRAVAR